jgi:hypothetical protein
MKTSDIYIYNNGDRQQNAHIHRLPLSVRAERMETSGSLHL